MYCENCRNEMSDAAVFCPSCGHPTAGQPQAFAPPTPGVAYQQYPTSTSSGTNGFAVASLVLGILWIFGLGSIMALVFGLIGRSQIEKSNGRMGGKGLAIAGIVLGAVGIVGFILWIILIVVAVNNNNCNTYGNC